MVRFASILLLAPSLAFAAPLLTAEQYADYSAQQHCLNQEYWDQPDTLTESLQALDKKFGIGEENFNEFDELAMEYDAQTAIQKAVEAKVKKLCP